MMKVENVLTIPMSRKDMDDVRWLALAAGENQLFFWIETLVDECDVLLQDDDYDKELLNTLKQHAATAFEAGCGMLCLEEQSIFVPEPGA